MANLHQTRRLPRVRAIGLLRPWLWAGVYLFLAGNGQAALDNSDWLVRSWQSDDGLPNNNVTGIAQSADGYLWVATAGHVARFDGSHFQEFTSKSVLPNYSGYTARISTLLEDSRGGLWLAMVHGPIVRLTTGPAEIFTNGLPDYTVQEMVEDGEGAIWLAYHGGAVCRIRQGQATRFREADGLPVRFDCTLARDRQGRIWFAKDGQIGRFQDGHFLTLAKSLVHSPRLTGAASGGVWVCTGQELLKCDDSGRLQSAGTCQLESPTTMLEDQAGAVWIGTAASGLYRFNGTGFASVHTSHSYISSLLSDREGGLWIGTGGGGVDRIQPRAFTLENDSTGLAFGTVQSVCEDAAHAIWAVTQNGVLACLTADGWHPVSTATNWPGGRAGCVTAGADGTVWIGTQSHALHSLRDGHYSTWRSTNGFPGHVVLGLLTDASNDLWIAEEDPNLVQCLHGGQFQNYPLPPESGVARAFTADAANDIWIGTSKGLLFRIHNGRLTDETASLTHLNASIRCLAATPDGSLWIGYASWGLGRLKNGHFSRLTTAQGLYNGYLSEIIPDHHGWLWFGSDRGLFKVRQEELDDVADGRAGRVLSIKYGEGDALPSLQANFGVSPNVLRSHDDRLWFPTRTALVVVNLRNLRESLQPPPVLLKQVMVDDQILGSYGGIVPVPESVDLSRPPATLALPPGHHQVQFEFTTLSFDAPGNMHCQYRLAGFDDDWVDAAPQRTANYSRLPPGIYSFQARARTGDGPWSEAHALELAVAPFFWQSWWFRTAMLILFTGGVIAIVRYVSFRRLHSRVHTLEQQAALDKERARIAKDIHDDLGGSLTQIKLLFELAQRQRTQPDAVTRLGQEGLAATRQIIKSLDEIVWAVNPRNDTLPHLIDYLGQFAIEFLARADIRCRVDLPDHPVAWAVSPEVRHNLFLAVKEALNNVIVHAEANEVWLRITATDRLLTIVIEDNGHGFDSPPDRDFADGLPNMKQRLAEIGGQSAIESRAGAGTRVTLILAKPGNS